MNVMVSFNSGMHTTTRFLFFEDSCLGTASVGSHNGSDSQRFLISWTNGTARKRSTGARRLNDDYLTGFDDDVAHSAAAAYCAKFIGGITGGGQTRGKIEDARS